MTIIVRSGNYIVSDSRFLADINNMHFINYNPGKFFILPEKTAVVGITGSVNSRESFDKIMDDVRGLIHAVSTNEEIDNTIISTSSDQSIIVALPNQTFTRTYAPPDLVESRHQPDYGWVEHPLRIPTAIGSGSHIVPPEYFVREGVDPVDFVRRAISDDTHSGGIIYRFDLRKLRKYGE